MGENEMHVGPTFSKEEVEAALTAKGYRRGTTEWHDALRRNYVPVEGRCRYVESENFDLIPAAPSPSSA